MNALVKFLKDEDGVVAIEYVVIAAVVVAAIVGVLGGLGTTLTTKFQAVLGQITSAGTTGTTTP